MKLAYPADIKLYKNGHVGISFPDIPEAITSGTTREEALQHAEDALVVALSGYLDERLPIPTPSSALKGQPLIVVPPHIALKLAVHQRMVEQNITQKQLAALLDCDDRQVRRILDINHESRISQVEAALAALGVRASVDIEPILAFAP
jgi:antitoxin HicB